MSDKRCGVSEKRVTIQELEGGLTMSIFDPSAAG